MRSGCGRWRAVLTNGMLAGIGGEYLLEVGAAYRQYYFVRLEQLPVAGEGHVHQVAAVVEVLEAAGYVVLEVLPTEFELVVHGGSVAPVSGKIRLFFQITIDGHRRFCDSRANLFFMAFVYPLWLVIRSPCCACAARNHNSRVLTHSLLLRSLKVLFVCFKRCLIRVHALTISSRPRPQAH